MSVWQWPVDKMEDAFTLTVRYQFVKNVSEWLPFPHVKAPDPFIQSCHLAAFPFFSSPLSLSSPGSPFRDDSSKARISAPGEEFSDQTFLSSYVRAGHVTLQRNMAKIMRWRVVGNEDLSNKAAWMPGDIPLFLFSSLGFWLQGKRPKSDFLSSGLSKIVKQSIAIEGTSWVVLLYF